MVCFCSKNCILYSYFSPTTRFQSHNLGVCVKLRGVHSLGGGASKYHGYIASEILCVVSRR